MKLTESKLRSIIREELIKEVGGPLKDQPTEAIRQADYFEVFHSVAAAMGQPSLETQNPREVVDFLNQQRDLSKWTVVANTDRKMLASLDADVFIESLNY